MTKLLITGASGKLGRSALHSLLQKGVAAGDIIATTRDPAKLSDLAAQGVEVRKADFEDTSSLVSAFAGADRLALISTDALGVPGQRLAQHQNAVAAAKAAGVAHILYTSMPNPSLESKIVFAGDHYGTEQAIKASGLSYTILRNSWYQENLLMSLPQALASGQWFTSAGAGRTSYIAHADCAEGLAAALLATETESKTYTLTGPVALTNAEIAAIATEVLAKPLQVINLTDEQLAGGMKASGVPEFLVPLLIGFEANTREGGVALVTGDFQTLTGKAPAPIEAFFRANRQALGG